MEFFYFIHGSENWKYIYFHELTKLPWGKQKYEIICKFTSMGVNIGSEFTPMEVKKNAKEVGYTSTEVNTTSMEIDIEVPWKPKTNKLHVHGSFHQFRWKKKINLLIT